MKVYWLILLMLKNINSLEIRGKVVHVEFPELRIQPLKSCELRNRVAAVVRAENLTLTLQLKKNLDVDEAAPVYVYRRGRNGVVELVKDTMLPFQVVAEYQDKDNFATVEISCQFTAANTFSYLLNGVLTFPDGNVYTLKFMSNVESSLLVGFYQLEPFEPLDINGEDSEIKLPEEIDVLEKKFHSKRSSGRRRSKRRTEPVYIDVVFLIDNSIYERWYNRLKTTDISLRKSETKRLIRRHFAHIANGINLRFQATSDRYNIRLVGYVIEDQQAEKWVTDVLDMEENQEESPRVINGDILFDNAVNWINAVENFPSYDHVVTWTAHDLYIRRSGSENRDIAGLAHVGTICTKPGISVSLCQFYGRVVVDMLTATHEIGHALGAQHDGKEENVCVKEDLYIMSTTRIHSLTSNNPFLFSSCSAEYFRNHVDDLLSTGSSYSRSCLTVALTSIAVPDISGNMPGQIYDPDTQCRLLHGEKSFFCRHLDQDSELICKQLGCYNKETDECPYIYAADGTSCGNEKWCMAGECLYSERAPEGNPKCLFGNTPGLVYRNQSCEEFIPYEFKYYCYHSPNARWCCETCVNYETNDADCRYGDNKWNTSCNADRCLESNGTNYMDMCCETCRNFRTTPATTTTELTSTTTRNETTTTTRTTTMVTTTTSTITSSETTKATPTTVVKTSTLTKSPETTQTTTTTTITVPTTPTTPTTTITTTTERHEIRSLCKNMSDGKTSGTVCSGGRKVVHFKALVTLVAICVLYFNA